MSDKANPVFFSDDAEALRASQAHTADARVLECEGRIAGEPDSDLVYLGRCDPTIDNSGTRRSWAVDAVGEIHEVARMPSGLWVVVR